MTIRPTNSRLITGIISTAVMAVLSITSVYAQPRRVPPAVVPDAVVMPRPSDSDLARAEAALASFMQGASAQDQALFTAYPYLLQVTPRPSVNSALVPNLAPMFNEKHENNKAVAKAGDIDVLFMGDSITDFWRNETGNYAGKPIQDEFFADLKIANFGIAGDTTQGVLYRLENGEGEGFSPKAIMLMIGTNNTRANIAGEIAEGLGAIVLSLQQHFPNAKILLLGIFPRSMPNDPVRAQIAEINSVISRLHDGKQVFYKDIGAAFLDANGVIGTDIMSDGLHPTNQGYRQWAEVVNDDLRALLK